jgi:hypothetical protein
VALPKVRTFVGKYYCGNILTALIFLRSQQGTRKFVIHADNVTVHTAQKCQAFREENRLWLTSHRPYSHHLAPSDFFLFRHLKQGLKGMVFASNKELLEAINEMMSEIPPESFKAVFDHWIERLEWISQNNGEDYPQAKH